MLASKRLLISLLLSLTLAASLHTEEKANEECIVSEEKKEISINLKDPVFSHGVIVTENGGVISTEGIRVQAQKIEYTNKVENGILVQKIVAEGDLMLEYGGHAFVGKKLEYDFTAKTGTLWEGKTSVDLWFVGGEKIALQADGSYLIYNAYLTTSESQINSWEINTGLIKISKDHLLSARNIRFKFFKVPLFWIPSFKSDLQWFRDPPIRYKLKWDKGLGPRLSMRYRIYSWEDLNVFFRFDYRLSRGPGAAIESSYHSKDLRTLFLSKNYGAFDKEVQDERGNKRYRLQGLFQTKSFDERTHVHMTYDKMSDDKMPGDFKSNDFEVNTQKRTILRINHQEDSTFASLLVQPRINRFQSLNQELPLFISGIRPFEIGSSGIISQNYVSAGYLDYVFPTDLHRFISDKHSVRMEANHQLYRPFKLSSLVITPQAGLVGIFYNNSPGHSSAGQLVCTYGGEAKTFLSKNYRPFKHVLEPYLTYQGLSRPTAGIDSHYIFNLDDGYARLDSFRAGFRNSFFSNKCFSFVPSFIADLYTVGFLQSKSTHQTFPKAYADLSWERPSFAIRSGLAWNLEQKLLDYSNIRTDFTINADFALGLEFRHRSRYDWRKADHENFVLDVARSLEDLLQSPVSDGRNTLLTRLYARLTPKVSCHIESHHGWGRRFEPRYNSVKTDVFVLLAANWVFKGSLQYTKEGGFSPTVSFALAK
jgi:hypothetical protein